MDAAAVGILFGDYELLARSGLFDPEFYVDTNPDVARLNIDPLTHYLEAGCRERRNPSAAFDTSHYLRQCQALGEHPINALSHYLTVGRAQGLTPKPNSRRSGRRVEARQRPSVPFVEADSLASQKTQELPAGAIYLDCPRVVDGAAASPVRGGLLIVGWAVAARGVVGVDIALDGTEVTTARCGMRRPDVAAAHPNWEGALLSGFVAHLPPAALAVGRRQLMVSVRDPRGLVARIDFTIEVQEVSDERGPWALRRKMSQAEVDLKLERLAQLEWSPLFRVFLPLRAGSSIAARRTLESLSRQTYPNWELCPIPFGETNHARHHRSVILRELIDGLDDVANKVCLTNSGPGTAPSARRERSQTAARVCFVLRPAAGDEFGCDALLEFALASGLDRTAELLYCDERRSSPVDGKADAFFKPGWSPDLLLSTNYIGRTWCADAQLLKRLGLDWAALDRLSHYELTLRLTEGAQNIRHVPKLLLQSDESGGDSVAQERRALTQTLKRRRITGKIHSGPLPRYYRVQRQLKRERVSIIIPTCGTDGLIKTCLETLRERTDYRDYEVIVIENIPATQRRWKRWLHEHADVVLQAGQPFNWSRYNNLGAAHATGKYLLFLNDDTEIIDPAWLDALLEHAQRPEVGVVGARLLYPDFSVQHGGVMLDREGRGRHAFRHLSERDPGYFGLALTPRNVISVTGACLLTRRETFEALGRFDEAHAVINNDLDYCLRSWNKGLLNVYTPYARLIHHELASRARLSEDYDAKKFDERWRRVIALGDPYFNPNLSRDSEQFAIDREPLETIYAGHPQFARESVRRILVVKLDHIGDCVTALPALRRVKRYFPAAHISVLAAHATVPIWKSEPLVDEVIEFNLFHARSGAGKIDVDEKTMQRLAVQLRAKRFDLAIDLRKQPDSRHVLECTGANILVGFDHAGRFPWLDVALEWDEDAPLRTKHGHISDDLVALVEAVATHSDRDRRAIVSAPLRTLGLPRTAMRRLFSKPLVGIHPAAGSQMRQWPPKLYAALINMLLDDGKFNVALLGGADEKALTELVLAGVERRLEVTNLVGRLTLPELTQVLAASALFVGNNSGPQHLAAGLGIPTVGIHSGVVDAHEWGPIGPQAVVVRRNMSCSPCYIEQARNCPRNMACLHELPVADVYRTCNTMLSTQLRKSKASNMNAVASLI